MRVLVVGQGLAGTLVSHFALRKDWDVRVIDAGFPSASAVAAGMFNPMSFRRIVEVWEAELHLRCMERTYQEIGEQLGLMLLHRLPIHKCLPNTAYAEAWNEKIPTIPWLQVGAESVPDRGIVHGGGWVDMKALLHGWRALLVAQGRFEARPMTEDDRSAPEGGTWDAIIDCRGIGLREQPHQVVLDIRSNRGELLTIAASNPGQVVPPKDHILNFGKWTLPLGDGRWRLGASYEWNRTDLEPTAETATTLTSALDAALDKVPSDWTIETHDVGLRPVSRDRRPVVGSLPGREGWFVLNGLGTRGVLIGPRWAQHLIGIIEGNQESTIETQPNRLILP